MATNEPPQWSAGLWLSRECRVRSATPTSCPWLHFTPGGRLERLTRVSHKCSSKAALVQPVWRARTLSHVRACAALHTGAQHAPPRARLAPLCQSASAPASERFVA